MRMIHWEGVELDGSDTSFHFATRDLDRVREAVAGLLGHPLVDPAVPVTIEAEDGWAPHRESGGELSETGSAVEVAEQVRRGALDGRPIVLATRRLEALEAPLLDRLVRHSAGREPPEPAFLLARRPHLLPDGCYLSPEVSVTVEAAVEPADPVLRAAPPGLAQELLAGRRPGVTVTLGPTFIYEYAMELVGDLIDRLVEVQVSGGLDCARGWTWGCTYAGSLYPFDKISVPGPLPAGVTSILRSPYLERPVLPGGYLGMEWWREPLSLEAAHDVQFVQAGRLLQECRDRPALTAAPAIARAVESIVAGGDQVRASAYVAHCEQVARSGLPARLQRDLTLVHLSLSPPEALPPALARQLVERHRQVLSSVVQLPRKKAADWRRSQLEPSNRVMWLGLDDEAEGQLACWVRPTIAGYAADLLALTLGHGVDRRSGA